MFVVRTLLVIVLILGVLLAWRSWKELPGLAVLAAIAAAAGGVLLFKSPVMAAVGLLVAVALIMHLSRPRRK